MPADRFFDLVEDAGVEAGRSLRLRLLLRAILDLSQKRKGRVTLRQRGIEAEAKLESAKLLAQAEVERAKGVAEANRIVADGLGGPEGYLRYLYIENLSASQGQIIYVPTEGGLPILEAGRRSRPRDRRAP